MQVGDAHGAVGLQFEAHGCVVRLGDVGKLYFDGEVDAIGEFVVKCSFVETLGVKAETRHYLLCDSYGLERHYLVGDVYAGAFESELTYDVFVVERFFVGFDHNRGCGPIDGWCGLEIIIRAGGCYDECDDKPFPVAEPYE